MRVLVTGATGLVGNNVVRLLLARGAQVRVLTRATSDPRPLQNLDLETASGDVRDPDSVASAVAGVDLVVHAAAHVHIGWSGLELARAVNVEGTRNVARAALRHGTRLVHVSSTDALGFHESGAPADEETPPNNGVLYPYVVTKRQAERALFELVDQGLQATIVNPGYMLGPWDWKPSSGRMLLHVARTWAIAAPPGGNNYCDVRDVAAGILAAAERGQVGRRYILAGESLDYFQAWTIMAEVTGARRPRVYLRPVVGAVAGWAGDALARLLRREPDINSAATQAALLRRNFTSARAERELGFRPTPLRDAASAAWQWFREHGYA